MSRFRYLCVRSVLAGGLMSFVLVAVVRAQQPAPAMPGAMSAEESAAVSQGWSLLARGRAADASALATATLAKVPRSVPALVLGIEADIAAAGSTKALDRYEAWLGARALEEPGVFRTIARAMLVEISQQPQNPGARIAALKALAQAGEAKAIESLQQGSRSGSLADTGALAAAGDPAAVQLLIAALSAGESSRSGLIGALAASGSPAAIGPIGQLLNDPEPTLRGEAAEALGRLGGQDAIALLTPALNDPSGFVRATAAAALYKLGDDSGAAILSDLAASEDSSERIVAAAALAGRPDDSWLAMVRELTTTPEPEIRLSAARLLASQDPAAARKVLDELAADENPAIRDEAVRTLAADLPWDLTGLRALLRNVDPFVRITAASRLLSLIR